MARWYSNLVQSEWRRRSIRAERRRDDTFLIDNWDDLTPKQKATKKIALSVLSHKRNADKSLTSLAKENHISIATLNHYTSAFKKIGRRWEADAYDRIARGNLPILTRGRLLTYLLLTPG